MNEAKGLLLGRFDERHIGAFLWRAVQNREISVVRKDTEEAFRGSPLKKRINWWLLGHRPAALRVFGREILEMCLRERPAWLLSVGAAPLETGALRELKAMGIRLMGYLTDDPWNPVLKAPWFLEGLPLYDLIFSPRRSNLTDFQKIGCQARYLPFAYDPEAHFFDPPTAEAGAGKFSHDVVFVGGADPDRAALLGSLMKTEWDVGLYGGYWDRFHETRSRARGMLTLREMRQAISSSRVALCLVRRMNRDGHSMRTFEIPAIGTCMLAEDTPEHLEILGQEGEAALYFETVNQLMEKLRLLLADESRRRALAQAARERVLRGSNTYEDRLVTMMREAGIEV